jgi:hypothetical protein
MITTQSPHWLDHQGKFILLQRALEAIHHGHFALQIPL